MFGGLSDDGFVVFVCWDDRRKGSMARSSFKLEHPLGLSLSSFNFPLILGLLGFSYLFIHLIPCFCHGNLLNLLKLRFDLSRVLCSEVCGLVGLELIVK